MRFLRRQRFWIILVVVLLIGALVALSLRGVKVKEVHFLESILYRIVSPFQKIVTNVNHTVRDYWTLVTNLKQIRAENQEYKQRVAELEFQLTDYQKTVIENQRLRKLLAFKELVPYKMVGAKVIGITPNNWVQYLIIDRGTEDGIQAKMPVITYNGTLVGQILKTTAHTSRVILLTDVNFVTSGRIQGDDSRAIGVIRGLPEQTNTVLMDQIPWDAEVKEDDLVVTSRLSTNFPEGIPIGKVKLVKEENFGLIQQAEIKAFMRLETVEEVLVITEF